jgi:hypothetical protein
VPYPYFKHVVDGFLERNRLLARPAGKLPFARLCQPFFEALPLIRRATKPAVTTFGVGPCVSDSSN